VPRRHGQPDQCLHAYLSLQPAPCAFSHRCSVKRSCDKDPVKAARVCVSYPAFPSAVDAVDWACGSHQCHAMRPRGIRSQPAVMKWTGRAKCRKDIAADGNMRRRRTPAPPARQVIRCGDRRLNSERPGRPAVSPLCGDCPRHRTASGSSGSASITDVRRGAHDLRRGGPLRGIVRSCGMAALRAGRGTKALMEGGEGGRERERENTGTRALRADTGTRALLEGAWRGAGGVRAIGGRRLCHAFAFQDSSVQSSGDSSAQSTKDSSAQWHSQVKIARYSLLRIARHGQPRSPCWRAAPVPPSAA
jgi:hypothetical protein